MVLIEEGEKVKNRSAWVFTSTVWGTYLSFAVCPSLSGRFSIPLIFFVLSISAIVWRGIVYRTNLHNERFSRTQQSLFTEYICKLLVVWVNP